MFKVLSLFSLLAVAAASSGAEIVLRPDAEPKGHVVRLGDVADVRTIDSDLAHRLKTLPLMPSPAPGVVQFVRRKQIEEMLVAQGEDLRDHWIEGALVVRVGITANRAEPVRPIPPARLTTASARKLNEIVRDAVLNCLRTSAAADAPWEIAFELTNAQQERLVSATTPIIATGGATPWTGSQRFVLRFTTAAGPISETLDADVVLPPLAVVATKPIARGTMIRNGDVELTRLVSHSQRTASPDQVERVETAVGLVASRSIRAGQPITESMLDAPTLVRRGDTVTVYARTGGVQVRTEAKAREDGGRGDLIVVETGNSRERIAVHVIGLREVSVFAQSVDATAYGAGAAPSASRHGDVNHDTPVTIELDRTANNAGPAPIGGARPRTALNRRDASRPDAAAAPRAAEPTKMKTDKVQAHSSDGLLKWQAYRRAATAKR